MKNFIFRLICFLPPLLEPTGLYFANDPDILSIRCAGKNETEYRIPDNEHGGRLELQNSKGKAIHVYVNKSKNGFAKK